MPSASYRVLSEFFRTNLNFTPNQSDVDQFERDLAVVSPALMRDALVELSQGRSRNKPAGAGQWRTAIYAIYNRKVAEHAQLFPLFHCFETAFRSRVAVSLEEHYGIASWWTPFLAALRAGNDQTTISRVGAINHVPSHRRRAIFLIVDEMTRSGVNLSSFTDGYELLQHSTLGQVKRVLDTHWPLFRSAFKTATGQQMRQEVFLAKFERIRGARNAVYHHLPFAGMTDVYNTAEELLRGLPFSLAKVHKAIANAPCSRPPYF